MERHDDDQTPGHELPIVAPPREILSLPEDAPLRRPGPPTLRWQLTEGHDPHEIEAALRAAPRIGELRLHPGPSPVAHAAHARGAWAALWASEEARRLHTLALGHVERFGVDLGDLAGSPLARSLKRLLLERPGFMRLLPDESTRFTPYGASVASLLSRWPVGALEELYVDGGELTEESLPTDRRMPALAGIRTLRVHDLNMPPWILVDLLVANGPTALETLELRLSARPEDEHLATLLAAAPELRAVHLYGEVDFMTGVLSSPLLERVEHLGLLPDVLTQDAARAIIELHPFPRPLVIELTGYRMYDSAYQRLAHYFEDEMEELEGRRILIHLDRPF